MKRIISLVLVLVLALSLGVVATGCASTAGSDDKGGSGQFGDAVPGGVGDVSAEMLEAFSNSGTVSVYTFTDSLTDEQKKFDQYFEEVYGGKIDRSRCNLCI